MTQPTKPRRRGCLFYGCFIGVVCLVAVLLALLAGVHYAKKLLTDYTSNHPVALPTVQVDPAKLRDARQRIQKFEDAIKSGLAAQPLTLTSDEINGLIANFPEFSPLKGKVFVTGLKDGRVQGDISVAMEELGLQMFRGRYLNGTITLNVWLSKGLLYVTPEQILANGKPLPGIYLDRLRKENLAGRANDQPNASVAIGKLQEIQVKDGSLTLVPKVE
jgi:hypothetical protein